MTKKAITPRLAATRITARIIGRIVGAALLVIMATQVDWWLAVAAYGMAVSHLFRAGLMLVALVNVRSKAPRGQTWARVADGATAVADAVDEAIAR